MGIPARDKADLLKIPPFIVKAIFLLYGLNRRLRPETPYDVPLLPFNIRAGLKFLSEYDTDFSRATLDGDLSKGFEPEEALKRVQCPMLLIRVAATRDANWGLLGAIDDGDLARIIALVPNLECVEVSGAHEVHMVQPARYLDAVLHFVDGLREKEKLGPLEPVPG
jgi:hypothetical protein